jgi:predicted PilT family ATPase
VDFQKVLSVVCDRLARLEDGVYVLAPPGSGRRGLARCLAGRGFKVFVPRGYGVETAEEYRDVEDLTRRLEGAGGLVYVVVSSSWEAVKLAASLTG